jgi:hypothetical protein
VRAGATGIPTRARRAALLVAAWLPVADAGTVPEIPAEARVKAAFVFNFARFTEWPPGTFAARTASFVVGVMGRTPLAEAVEETLGGKRVHGREIVVRRFTRPDEITGPVHILVLDEPRPEISGAGTAASASPPVLTIGESPGFCRRGGTIGFFLEDGKVRFEVNVADAERRGLRFSSSLLRLARIVERDRARSPVPSSAVPDPPR